MNGKWRWFTVVTYAAAMAWAESAAVLYMRIIIESGVLSRRNQLLAGLGLGQAELIREAATLMMLVAVAWMAGQDRRTRLGYLLLAFGVWDLLYYVFLIPLTGWPQHILDWDLLFLIPLPWWGPVLAPVSIAMLMVLLGTLIILGTCLGKNIWPRKPVWAFYLLGMIVTLYVFMADSINSALQGNTANYYLPPVHFNWTIFLLGLGLMLSPILAILRESLQSLREHFTYSERASSGGVP